MIYMNDCSIRVVQSYVKIIMLEIFKHVLHTKIILQKKVNYSSYLVPAFESLVT